MAKMNAIGGSESPWAMAVAIGISNTTVVPLLRASVKSWAITKTTNRTP